MSVTAAPRLEERQQWMRDLASRLERGDATRREVREQVRELIRLEEDSASKSQDRIDRTEHNHVKASNHAALQNRLATVRELTACLKALSARDTNLAIVALEKAANCGGKKSVKAAREKGPTVAMYVQYLAETDADFQAFLTRQGVTL